MGGHTNGLRRLSLWFRWRRFDADIRDELEFHRAEIQRALETQGMRSADARSESRRRMGNAALAREDARDELIWRWIDSMAQDVRQGLRSIRRTPSFYGVAILTIALGIALTSTIFSVADNILFRSLPYPQADRLYELYGAARAEGQFRISPAAGDYLSWRFTGDFSGIGAYRWAGVIAVNAGPVPHNVNFAEVDDEFLSTLGVAPLVGRAFTKIDCEPGAPPVAIISSSLWRADFGADPAIVDHVVALDAVPTRIVGVLPSDFIFPAAMASVQRVFPVDVLRPLILTAAQRADHNDRAPGGVIGRLRPEVTAEVAGSRLDAVQQANRPLYRRSNVIPGAFDGVTLVALQTAVAPLAVHRSVVLLLLAAVGVLLVATVNITNMLLARGLDRERELVIRAAIGASRARLARLLLAEAIVLAVMGGAAGIVLARIGFRLVVAQLPLSFVALRAPRLDMRVAFFALFMSVIVGLAFGLLPAVRLSRLELTAMTKEATATATPRFRWIRDTLIVAEMTVAVMLLGAGALVLRSFENASHADLGMDTAHVLTMQVTAPLSLARAAPAARDDFFRGVLAAVQAVGGVRAAFTTNLLMIRANKGSNLALAGVSSNLLYSRGSMVTEVEVTRDYFRVMGIPILRGSPFPDADRADDPVAIVADHLARAAGVDPIGRDLVSLREEDPRRYRVIGVVPDTRDRAPDLDPLSTVYLPFDGEDRASATLVVRCEQPVGAIDPVRQAIHAAQPGAMVDQIRPLDELARRAIAERRFNAFLYGAFSLSALVLSMIGIYGVIRYVVERRVREIGIRIALGATPRRVVWVVTGHTLVTVAIGVAAGFLGLGALQTSLRSLVFGILPSDPLTLSVALAVLVAAAGGAAYMPVRRATHVDPMIALRAE